MGFQEDVLGAVKLNRAELLRFYVDVYHGPGITGAERSAFRADAIARENSLLSKDVMSSAKLQVAEFLDANPGMRLQAQHAVAEMHRLEQTPQMMVDTGHHGYDAGAVAREQMNQLTGGFIGALVQGVANEIWHDPKEAMEKAAPFLTLAHMTEAHGEAIQAKHEVLSEMADASKGHTEQQAVKEIGPHDVGQALGNINSGKSAEQFPETAKVLGEHAVEALKHELGEAQAEALLHALHPGEPMPGYGGYAEGYVHHPEVVESVTHAAAMPGYEAVSLAGAGATGSEIERGNDRQAGDAAKLVADKAHLHGATAGEGTGHFHSSGGGTHTVAHVGGMHVEAGYEQTAPQKGQYPIAFESQHSVNSVATVFQLAPHENGSGMPIHFEGQHSSSVALRPESGTGQPGPDFSSLHSTGHGHSLGHPHQLDGHLLWSGHAASQHADGPAVPIPFEDHHSANDGGVVFHLPPSDSGVQSLGHAHTHTIADQVHGASHCGGIMDHFDSGQAGHPL